MTTTTIIIQIITILLQHCNNATIMSVRIFTLKQSFHTNTTEKKYPADHSSPVVIIHTVYSQPGLPDTLLEPLCIFLTSYLTV